ncbi:membrane protein [Cypionkella aquatica]|uniref:Membrane protein n=1 Tax=Cypionkella aquatica TaxID=1756042 RepID=A0AA37X2C7_9RHOB|nr:DUF599 domain-containing protein [Cypionkella aquatica]GLS88742.1 membrane protein [Cypionkella aquatica]
MINIGPLGTIDALCVALTLFAWAGIGWLIEHPPAGRPSVSILMKEYRREWMRQFLTRQPRIFDASIIDSLRQGTAFFASASLIAIGGGIALIGNPTAVVGLAKDLTLPADATGLQLRVLLVIMFLANAVLKFIWSNRLFGYCAVMMAAVPNDPADPMAPHRAAQAGELNITAAKSFNRGLHSIYFALGSLGWLLGPYVLVATTLLTSAVLLRREFASESRKVMLHGV